MTNLSAGAVCVCVCVCVCLLMIKRKGNVGRGQRCGCIRFPPLGVDVVLDFSLGCWLTVCVSVCVSKCVCVCVCVSVCVCWECTEEERNFSFNFPQLQILHPRALFLLEQRPKNTKCLWCIKTRWGTRVWNCKSIHFGSDSEKQN